MNNYQEQVQKAHIQIFKHDLCPVETFGDIVEPDELDMYVRSDKNGICTMTEKEMFRWQTRYWQFSKDKENIYE